MSETLYPRYFNATRITADDTAAIEPLKSEDRLLLSDPRVMETIAKQRIYMHLEPLLRRSFSEALRRMVMGEETPQLNLVIPKKSHVGIFNARTDPNATLILPSVADTVAFGIDDSHADYARDEGHLKRIDRLRTEVRAYVNSMKDKGASGQSMQIFDNIAELSADLVYYHSKEGGPKLRKRVSADVVDTVQKMLQNEMTAMVSHLNTPDEIKRRVAGISEMLLFQLEKATSRQIQM